MNELNGKIALVTGGAGGIGSAICQRLADEGATVIITYNNNSEKAEKLKMSLRGRSKLVVIIQPFMHPLMIVLNWLIYLILFLKNMVN